MKTVLGIFMVVMIAVLGAACATSFTGSAHVEDGRKGCEKKCKGQGMELVGMVYMGEYSDACVCSVPGQSGSVKHKLIAGAGAVAGGASGVVMQMRRNEENNRNSGINLN